jgi:hypothetical protein
MPRFDRRVWQPRSSRRSSSARSAARIPNLLPTLDAYDLFLRALSKYYQWTRADNDMVVLHLRAAIELDPAYALAKALLSFNHVPAGTRDGVKRATVKKARLWRARRLRTTPRCFVGPSIRSASRRNMTASARCWKKAARLVLHDDDAREHAYGPSGQQSRRPLTVPTASDALRRRTPEQLSQRGNKSASLQFPNGMSCCGTS